mmetsp:Transcript_32266/g.67665  ORF Transcript_32266/g.67665 Transcript_32266/m.67665 type:complete len:108 (+) Transcript_32266:359-682(+)
MRLGPSPTGSKFGLNSRENQYVPEGTHLLGKSGEPHDGEGALRRGDGALLPTGRAAPRTPREEEEDSALISALVVRCNVMVGGAEEGGGDCYPLLAPPNSPAMLPQQ